MSGFLLDTNVVSELIRPKPDTNVARWVHTTDLTLLYLSVLTLGEIQKGIYSVESATRRANLEKWLQLELRPDFAGRILSVDEAIAECWGALTGSVRQTLPAVDSLLAATALHYNLILVTRNVRDFARTGVRLFNPWES